MTLTEFLLARIAEDETVARGAIDTDLPDHPYDGPQVDDGHWSTGDYGMDERRIEGVDMTIYDEGGHTAGQARHIARHDPARVLTECAAKRQRAETLADLDMLPEGERVEQRVTLRWVVALDAAVYADHPDYREEWRP